MKKSHLEAQIEKELKGSYYSPLDVFSIVIEYQTFTDIGTIYCPEGIKSFADTLVKIMRLNKHPTLNPVIDKIYEEVEDEEEFAFEEFIKKEGIFRSEKVDNKKQFLSIKLPVEILAVNVKEFIESEEVKIVKAEVQTALFKREIK